MTADPSGTIVQQIAGVESNPTSTLTLTSATTARSANTLVANNATAGSIVVPSLTLTNPGALIPRLRLSINDATSTAWGAVSVQIDLWSAAPTFTNGDGGAFAVATGAANHLGSYTGTFSAVAGDGVYAELAPVVGTVSAPRLAAPTIYWSMIAVSATGVTGASKTVTLTAETLS